MEILLKEITIRELAEGYSDNDDSGVVGYNGRLDIRPPYQREFIYKDKQRDAVITTVKKSFPLNVMYWAVRDDNGFEVIDGQQRTISICQYINGDFGYEGRYFFNLTDDEKKDILDYKLMIYQCSGTDSEKLEWFKTINIAGEQLTQQELRNAVYSGSWVSDAKRYFSKNGCVAYSLGSNYINGTPIRQDYLETIIKWISNDHIEYYMGSNQHKPDASELWIYFQSVINWTKSVFPNYRKEMKGVDWGSLYEEFKDTSLDIGEIESRVKELMLDDDVTNKKGIYPFVLTGKQRLLNIRAFTPSQKRQAYEKQDGICSICGEKFTIEQMEADHITPWSEGGKTELENCQMLCKEDNRRKSSK
jgi:hypothetical protein